LLSDVAFSYAVSAGVCLIVWRLQTGWRWLLLATFVYFAAWVPQATGGKPGLDLPLYAGLVCWGLLFLMGSGKLLWFRLTALTALVLFGALAKVPLLIAGGVSVGAVTLSLIAQGRLRLALAGHLALLPRYSWRGSAWGKGSSIWFLISATVWRSQR